MVIGREVVSVAIATAGVTVTGNETPAEFRRSDAIISLLGQERFCGVSLSPHAGLNHFSYFTSTAAVLPARSTHSSTGVLQPAL